LETGSPNPRLSILEFRMLTEGGHGGPPLQLNLIAAKALQQLVLPRYVNIRRSALYLMLTGGL
jgi:hypothetical protein